MPQFSLFVAAAPVFFVLSKLFDLFLSPLTWGLVLLAAAVPWRRRKRPSRRPRILGGIGLGILLVASMPGVSNALWWSMERREASSYRSDVTYDVVVLLGGVGDERVWAVSGQPSYNENVERLLTTRDLLVHDRARFVIVSGGVNEERYRPWNEAKMLADELVDLGVARDRILLEEKAKNTRENATLSAKIIRERGFAKVLGVTSAFHVPRAADCFRAVGLDVDWLPVDYRAHERTFKLNDLLPRTRALDDTTAITREWFGRWIYRVQGYGKGR